MVSNAAMMYGMMPNMYYNQIAMNDLTNMNLSYPVGMGMMDPMFSMNSSIFGGGMNYGMGMPFMPSFGGGGIDNYYKNYEKYQDFMIDSQVRQQQKMRNANLQLTSPEEGIKKQAELLHEKILQDEQEQIKVAYDQYISSVRAMYGDNATAEQIENRADAVYKQLIGTTVHDDIRKNGKGSFTQGLLQTLTFGLADGKTAEENISTLTGLPVARSEAGWKFAGNIAGGAVVGGATCLATVPLLKALKVGAKNKTMWGMIAGAAVGLVTALTTSK